MAAVAACGGGGSGGGSEPSAAGSPQVGGTLTFGSFAPVTGLDPIVTIGSGSSGLIETTAVYDTLLRYNYDTGKYDGGTAESMQVNADATEFTLKIRPGVTFTDGSPYDADAVVFGLNRARAGLPGAPDCASVVACPRNTSVSAYAMSFVKDVVAVDGNTVKITLREPLSSFPSALASEAGEIPSPTALKKCDPAAPAAQCAFNTAPVGAGPFMVTSYKPGEAITMVRNPNYWGGQVYLDGLRFVVIGDGGGQRTLDALQANQVQAAFLRDPVAIAAAHDDGLQGATEMQYGAQIFVMNMRSGAATHDVRVRQAVAAAVDPQTINQRAYQGKATLATTQMLSPSFTWYPDVPAPAHDLDKARALVAAAKADGWNGHIRVLTNNTPAPVNVGLAVQAMLQNVGMTVDLDSTKDSPTETAAMAKGEFDLGLTGSLIGNDDTASTGLAQFYQSDSPTNRSGIDDPTMDAAFQQLFAAQSDADKKAAYKRIATELNAQMPALSIATFEQFVPWNSHVHGVRHNIKTAIAFDKAWLS